MRRTTKSIGYRSAGMRRGSIFATAMWILIALAAVVLVMGREMTVEAIVSKQHLSQAQADAAEQGVEQFAVSVMDQEYQTPGYMDQLNYQARPIGNCYFWLIRQNPDPSLENTADYGMTDEAAKIDINSATESMLELLPNMDINVAAEIIDWRDPDENVTQAPDGAIGAESTDYGGLTVPYSSKDAPFESVDEMMLLEDMTPQLAWGVDTNHNNVADAPEINAAGNSGSGSGGVPNFNSAMSTSSSSTNTLLGIFSFCTVYGIRATNADTTSTSSSGTTGGITSGSSNGSSSEPMITDINQSSQMQQLLSYFGLPSSYATGTAAAGGGGGAAGGGANRRGGGRGGAGAGAAAGGGATQSFQSVWDWVNQNTSKGLTDTQLQQVYPYLMYNPPATTANTNTNTNTNTSGTTATAPNLPYAKLNILHASEEAMMCLPGWSQQDADAVISYRENNPNSDPTQETNIYWLMDVISSDAMQYVTTGPNLMSGTTGSTSTSTTSTTSTDGTGNTGTNNQPTANPGWGGMVTGSSTIYSADIVTVSQDGRAFKRVVVVVDDSSGVPQIVSRKDLSGLGWPMDPSILTSLRNGQGPAGSQQSKSNSPLSLSIH